MFVKVLVLFLLGSHSLFFITGEAAEVAVDNGIPQPCVNLSVLDGPEFFYKNQHHLFRYTKSYFERSKMIQNCHLKYIDISKVEPHPPSEHVWIAYVGDSLARELFMGSAIRFTDFIPFSTQELRDDLIEKQPFLGGHLGPVYDADIGLRMETYHQTKLVCCSLNNEVQEALNRKNISSSCIYAMDRDSVSKARGSIILRKFRMYLFDNVTDYIENFISPLFIGSYKCLSFAWAPTFIQGAEMLLQYHSNPEVRPNAVIMNMALHEHNGTERGLKMFRSATEETNKKYGTKYILHSGTFVNDSGTKAKETVVQEKHVRFVDHLVRTEITHWKSLGGRYLDLHNYSRALHSTPGCSAADGVHFLPKCNYQAFVTQWDFNWLNYLKVIKTQNNILSWTSDS